MNYSFITLGCSKNIVDSEIIVGQLDKAGYQKLDNPEEAELLFINTCSFIREAVEESIDTTLELSLLKEKGKAKALILCGCLPQRYSQRLIRNLPEVDAFVGTGYLTSIVEIVQRVLKGERVVAIGEPQITYSSALSRKPLQDLPYAYLKIAEGCNHICSFCVIPKIRGSYRSRPLDDLLKEALELAKHGAKELVLIAQDTTSYGFDLYGINKLPVLLKELCKLKAIKWIRLLYSHPYYITDELLQVIAEEDKICKYIDLPLQHCNERILKFMKRGGNRASLSRLIERIRKAIPGIAIRTTFIVGYPGETEEEFEELLSFIKSERFDRLGAFPFYREEGTEAFSSKGQIHWKVRQMRWRQLMQLQQTIAAEINMSFLNSTIEVIVESKLEDFSLAEIGFQGKEGYLLWSGRSRRDAPEVDGRVYILSRAGLNKGDIIKVKIIDAQPYDLLGVRVGDISEN